MRERKSKEKRITFLWNSSLFYNVQNHELLINKKSFSSLDRIGFEGYGSLKVLKNRSHKILEYT